MRENFLSLNDISKQRVGYKFYNKEGDLFELISIEEKHILVASGLLGDKYDVYTSLKVIDDNGTIYTKNSITNNTIGDNFSNIEYVKNNWDSLDYYEYNYYNKLNKPQEINISSEKLEYINYLNEMHSNGFLNKEELNKRIIYELQK